MEEKLAWGLCGTPLLVDDKLIFAPGSPEASIVALDAKTGKVLWKTPGGAPPVPGRSTSARWAANGRSLAMMPVQ